MTATHERGATASEALAASRLVAGSGGGGNKFLHKPAVWAAGALLGGGVAWSLNRDAMTQVRRSHAPTRVEIGYACSEAEARRRIGAFAETLRAVEDVELHWWNPQTARILGRYLEGDVRLRDGWADVTMRVHGPLRVQSQNLHTWMVGNLRRAMDV